MLRAIITLQKADVDKVRGLLGNGKYPFTQEISSLYATTNTVNLLCEGYLHMEVTVARIRDHLRGIQLQISEPEVIFQQPMMKVRIQAPVIFERDILNELSIRHMRCPHVKPFSCYQQESDWVFETRLPLLVLRHLVKTLRTIGKNDIIIYMTPDGSDDITEKQLKSQLSFTEK